MRDERKLDNGMNGVLKMDTRKPVMYRVHTTLERFEAYVHKNQLDETLRPGGRWGPVHARSVATV